MYDYNDDIAARIRELAAEDDWGSWELWWDIVANVPKDKLAESKKRFLSIISDMILRGELIPKRHVDGKLQRVAFDAEELSREVDLSARPDPDSSYWFGTR